MFSGTGGTVTVVNPIANSLTFSASAPYLLESGTLTMSGNDLTLDSNATIASAVNSAGNLYVMGSGTLTLTGSASIGSGGGDLTVGNSGTGTLLITNGGAVSDIESGSIGANGGSSGMVTVSGSGSTWTTSSTLYIGEFGTGTLMITGGGAVSDNQDTLGYISSGMVTVSGSGSTWTDEVLYVGESGTGTLMITSGGAVSTSVNGYIGDQAGSSGTVTVDGSGSMWTISGSHLYVGNSGTGTLMITGGGAVSDSQGIIGENPGSSGMATVSGSGSMWTNSYLFVGSFGAGTLTITNGGAVSTSIYAHIGDNPGSNGMVTVSGSGSQWTDSGGLYVGNSGTGTLLITSGGAVSDAAGYIGTNAGTSGTVTVDGTGSTWTNSTDLYVGNSGTGTLLISNGGAVSNYNGWIGYNPGSTGVATVDGIGSIWMNSKNLLVGESGSGTLSITSGGAASDVAAAVGDQAGSSGAATVDGTGSSWTNSGDLFIGNDGSGTLLITNGGAVTSDTGSPTYGAVIGSVPGSTGAVTVSGSGSTLTVDDANLHVGFNGTGTLSITSGGAAFDVAAAVGDQAGSSGAVTVDGTGSSWTNSGDLIIGNDGSGTLLITNGGAVSSDTVSSAYGTNIGLVAGSTGAVTVSGSGSSWTDKSDLYVGNSGMGTLTITSGGAVSNVNGFIADYPGSAGVVTVDGTGSTWSNASSLYIGGNSGGPGGAGLLFITNGGSVSAAQTTVWNTGTLVFGENPILNSPLSVSGGTVTLVDGEVQTVTLTRPVSISNGSNLDFEVGAGSDQIAFSSPGLLSVTGTAMVNLYGLTGQVTSGTDILISATSGALALGNVYNSGNFTYALLTTATSEDVVVTSTSALTTAYWKGGQNNIWSILVGGTGTNWTTDPAGTIDPHLTPSATTDVIFSSSNAANEANTVLGTNMTIKSLTVNDPPPPVGISGIDVLTGQVRGIPAEDTLTVDGSTGTTGITVNTGVGLVTIGANLVLDGSSQTVTVNNAAGMLVSGNIGGSNGLVKAGPGLLTLTGIANFGTRNVDVEGGTLAIQNGGAVTDGIGFIGNHPGSTGAVTVDGTGSRWTNLIQLSVGESGIGTLTITDGGVVSNAGIGFIGLDGSSSGMVTVDGTGSTWTINSDLYVGDSGTGTLTISDAGTLSNSGIVYIGYNPGSSGKATVDGSGSTWTHLVGIYVGDSGTGTLTISNGGSVSNSGIVYIGYSAGSSGMVTVDGSGSSLTNTSDLYVGDSGTGTLTISDAGTLSNSGIVYIGYNPGSSGKVMVSGAGSSFDSIQTFIGSSGGGTLFVSAGGNVFDATGYAGYAFRSSGMVTVDGSGSTWTNSSDLYVGNSGSGTLTISNGGTVSNATGYVGNNPGSSGKVMVSGAGSSWESITSVVGSSGNATMFIAGSGNVFTGGPAYIGLDGSSSGMVTVDGTGSTWRINSDLVVGNSGSGSLAVTNGGAVSDATGYIGNNPGSSGRVMVFGAGSSWESITSVVGSSGSATMFIAGGGFAFTGGPAYIGLDGSSSGMVTVDGTGSTWRINSDLVVGNSGSGSLAVTGGGAVSNVNSYVGNNPGSSGRVTVDGSGSTWTNSGNLYIGGYSGGAGGAGLLFLTNGGLVSAAQTTVWPPGTLAFGDPTLNSPLNVNGGTLTLVDGEVQTVTLTNPVAISNGSNLDFEVGSGSDQIALSGSGSITVTGTATVNLYGLSGQVTAGTYVLISATSGKLSLANVYNSGNFTYALLSTATSEDVVVTAAAGNLNTAYWKGAQNNLWSILVGGTGTNWTTDPAGTTDPHLTPSATTDVIFSATTPAKEGATVLGTDMTIKSLTVGDTNAVMISGSNPNPWLGTNTLTVSGSTGTTGITVNPGAGPVTIGANLDLTGSSQTVTVNNAAGLLVSGSLASSNGLTKSGTGFLILAGNSTYAGATNVNGGTLIVTGSLSGTLSTSVAAGAGLEVDGMLSATGTTSVTGTLSGIGQLGTVVVKSGATVDPGLSSTESEVAYVIRSESEGAAIAPVAADGASPNLHPAPSAGTLTATGNVTLNATSTFSIRLGVASPGDGDQLAITNGGTVSLNSATLQLNVGAFVQDAPIDTLYVIINGGATDTGPGFSNTFAQGTSISEPGGYTFKILYASQASGSPGGSDVVLELTGIPEPGTRGMLLGGLALFTLWRRPRFARRRGGQGTG